MRVERFLGLLLAGVGIAIATEPQGFERLLDTYLRYKQGPQVPIYARPPTRSVFAYPPRSEATDP